MKKLFLSPLVFAVLLLSLILSCEPDPVDPPPPIDPPPSDATVLWEKSAHADTTSLSFTYWDNNDPPEIPTRCAKCHSTDGFIDFLGADGSTEGVVDKPVAVGHGTNNINCLACHVHADSDDLRPITTVAFPSGMVVDTTEGNATCLNCHQGMRSGSDIDRVVAGSGAGEDEVSENLTFINIHYSVAAAIQYGSEVQGGYEYPGENYAGKYRHVRNWSSCIECHNPHSLEVNFNSCYSCHPMGFNRELNELDQLQSELYEAMRAYALTYTGVGIIYNKHKHPYFFAEGSDDQRYNSWTPRLLKAAYNYHVSKNDKGAYTHNLRYVRQLLQTSIDDIKSVL